MTDLTKAAREALEACETALRQFTKTPSTLADSTARGNAHAALANLRAALDEAPGEEREAFEAWWAGLCPAPYYPGIEKEIARNAWQARAMLAARPEAPKVAPSHEAVLAEMREFARARLPDFLGAHHMALVLSQQINRWVDQLAARHSAPAVALTEEQRAVLLFLEGWESLDGVWFGDPHPTQTGAFWWRRHLVRAFPWLTKGKEGGA